MNKRKAYYLYNFSYFHTLLYENEVILIIINFLYLRYIYDSILIKIDRDRDQFYFSVILLLLTSWYIFMR